MRHRKQRSRLSMMTARRKATMINMVSSLFIHQKVETILARAKVARRLAEKLITIGKKDTVAARRRAYQILNDRDLVGKLFTEIAPRHKNRTSGYTRIIQLGFRRGDGAKMAILELTDKKIVEKLPKKKGKEAAASEPKKTAKQTAPEEVKKPAEEKKEVKKDEQNIKHIPKSKPSFEDEKRNEKAKSEERKIAGQKGFMKNLRGLFRKRGDR
ncbi:MAG: 50S ribosomal protein L17 [Candidatus Omnitrophica bacterium]|nr:50S ribosomal protein L17 [Candidatus Omnitrophota bacterium]